MQKKRIVLAAILAALLIVTTSCIRPEQVSPEGKVTPKLTWWGDDDGLTRVKEGEELEEPEPELEPPEVIEPDLNPEEDDTPEISVDFLLGITNDTNDDPVVEEKNEVKVGISARRFAFSPTDITVPKGSKIVFSIRAEDRDYDFAIRNYINTTDLPEDESVQIIFEPPFAKVYEFYSPMAVGADKENMRGVLRVE